MMEVGALAVQPLATRIGCEIRAEKAALLSGEHAAEIRRLLVAHGVLCFPGIGFDKPEQIALARSLGRLVETHDAGLMKVSADSSVNPDPELADYQKSSVFWHWDDFGETMPKFATMMNPQALADGTSGATEFANCYAAYDDLPEADKRLIEGLRVYHSLEALMQRVKPWPLHAELTKWQRYNGTHPMVWTHRSGRKSLLLGASALSIEGMDPEAGRALICRINEWMTQPQFTYRYEWRIGDFVIWDNTGTMHRAVPYGLSSGRLMLRSTLEGEEVPG